MSCKPIEDADKEIVSLRDKLEDCRGGQAALAQWVEELEAELERYRWISVDEKLPEIFDDVVERRSKTMEVNTSILSLVLAWYTEAGWFDERGPVSLVDYWREPILPEGDE